MRRADDDERAAAAGEERLQLRHPVLIAIDEEPLIHHAVLFEVGQDDPFDDIELLKLYEVQKYASLTNHSWSGYNMLANLQRWQQLPADVQHSIETNTRKYAQLQRQDTDRLNDELRVGLTRRGMVINEVDRASFRPALTAFYPKWREAIGTRAWDLLEANVGRLG